MSYRDIMRGPELQAEYEQYIAYKRRTRAQKQAAYKGLNVNKFTYDKQLVYVAPFGQPQKSAYVELEMCAAGTPTPGSEGLSLGDDYFETVKPAGATDILLNSTLFPKNKLAKMILKHRVSTTTENSESRITGRSYKRHPTNSVSIYLGKNVATDDFSDVVTAIKGKAAYETFVKPKGNTITFIPEG